MKKHKKLQAKLDARRKSFDSLPDGMKSDSHPPGGHTRPGSMSGRK